MQKDAGITINLVKNRGETFLDRFIVWALNVGRVVVILTEGIALVAFIYRFSLDQQLVDLHNRIGQEQAILKLLANNEKNYRSVQERLSLSQQIITQSAATSNLFQTIIGYVPSTINITNVTFASDNIRFDLSASSIDPITSLVNKLKANPAISSVSIDKIDNRTATSTLSVTITALIKSGKIKQL